MAKKTATPQPEVKRGDIKYIPPSLIVIKNPNPREYYDPIKRDRLKASIRQKGVKECVHVRKVKGEEKYELTHGFTRMAIVWELLEEGVQILSVPAQYGNPTEEQELIDHITFNDGEPLTKYEVSKIMTRLSNLGWKNKNIAEETGYTEEDVSKLISFQNSASAEVKNAVASGELNLTPAMSLVKETPDTKKQGEIIKKARVKAEKEVEKKQQNQVFNATADEDEEEEKFEAEELDLDEEEENNKGNKKSKPAPAKKEKKKPEVKHTPKPKVKIKAKDILSKKLSFQDKFTKVVEMFDEVPEEDLDQKSELKRDAAKEFYDLLTNRNLEPEEILKKFLKI